MKRTYKYKAGNRVIEREYNYIPVRYIISIMLIAFEIFGVVAVTAALCYFIPYFYLAAWATEIFCVIKIVSSDDNPEYKVPWLLLVLVIPIAGFMLYFLFYKRNLDKKLLKRLRALNSEKYEVLGLPSIEELKQHSESAALSANMLTKISHSTLFDGGRVEYFSLGEEKMTRLLSDLRSAEKFIFMEYFIIEDGKFWGSILDILKEKASRGVEVRVIYDDFGCMATLPGDYARELGKYGIRALPFARLKPSADGEFNNRSHRKIAVIDGTVGYTGGVNIADEYINERVRFGHWKDTAVRIEGRAVWELTRIF